jgi:endonuclease/exonuclease/phosphatase family metal-dependent hydrolase
MRLRIGTFNVENLDEVPAPGLDFADRIRALSPALLRMDADVLCLQEVNARHPTKHAPRTLGALDRLVEGTPYASFARIASERVGGGFFDVHNLVVLSRLPIRAHAQHWHDLVLPPTATLRTAPPGRQRARVAWDRPVLEVVLEVPGGRALHVFDAHLRAPLAAAIEGQKLSRSSWRTTSGWAEGYFLAAVKRTGQALELRLHVDRLLDEDRGALLLVAGDLNADLVESPLRILCAAPGDTGNPSLATRRLVPLEERVPDPRPASVIHEGRRLLLDHLLASPALAEAHRATSLFSEDLADDALASSAPPGSFHAPIVAEFAF